MGLGIRKGTLIRGQRLPVLFLPLQCLPLLIGADGGIGIAGLLLKGNLPR